MYKYGGNMIKVNINELLKKEHKTKYWLCKVSGISRTNLDNVIKGNTNAISFTYIEKLCYFLNCTPNELFTIEFEKSYDYD